MEYARADVLNGHRRDVAWLVHFLTTQDCGREARREPCLIQPSATRWRWRSWIRRIAGKRHARVPNLDRPIVTAACDALSIRAEHDSFYPVGVSF